MRKSSVKILNLLVMLFFFVAPLGSGANAQSDDYETPQFFMGLNDIPLMPGLEELVDRSLVFEKPGGRIGESTAISDSNSFDSVQTFYAKTLPQLGWRIINGESFVRDNEKLTISIEKRDHYLESIEGCLGAFKEDKALMLNWDEVRLMHGAGISFGAHTRTHPILTQLPPEKAKRDIFDSKECIEGKLGVKVRHFAYPNGRKSDFNEDLRQYCREIGFSSISSFEYGHNKISSDVWHLKRIGPESPISLFAINVTRAFLTSGGDAKK